MQKPQLAIAVAGLALVAAPAFAQNEPVVIEGGLPTARVSYADLNIRSPAGRRALEGRVTRAASSLCVENFRQTLTQYGAERRCFSLAMAKAHGDIDLAVARANVSLTSAALVITVAAK